MTYTAATFDAAWREERRSSSDTAGRALRFARNSAFLALGATGFVGAAAVAATLAAGWMAAGTVEPHVRLPSGPASLALVPHDQMTRAVALGQGGSQWANAFVDRARPILPAEKARPTIAETKITPIPRAASTPAIPLPRPVPARLAQVRAEIDQPQPAAIAQLPVVPSPATQAPASPPIAIPSIAMSPVMPLPTPEGMSKLGAMAKLDPKTQSGSDAKAPPKPAPVASIPATLPDSVSRTAVYDITGSVVHMPDGSKLEAHSGLGDRKDDPRHIKVRMRGPTPPNVYVLTEREQLFHGVRAIRLNPVHEDKMFGRDGMLAHSYMLGPNGQSNGCVSFKDYKKFLTAFLDGKVDKLVVVPDLDGMSWKTAALQAEGVNASRRRFAGNYSRPRIFARDDDGPRYTSALGFAAEHRGAGTW